MPLPKEILIKRIKNELAECRKKTAHHFKLLEESLNKIPIEINVTLVNTPGPIFSDGKVLTKYTHKLKIIITADYPYQTPIVRWKSEIFHPNIMPPEEGGYVCTKLLDNWSVRSNLLAFIKGIETLLSYPNPKNPFESDTCTRAAEYFNKNPFNPAQIKSRPRIIGEDG